MNNVGLGDDPGFKTGGPLNLIAAFRMPGTISLAAGTAPGAGPCVRSDQPRLRNERCLQQISPTSETCRA